MRYTANNVPEALTTILDALPVCIQVLGPDLRVVFLNKRLRAIASAEAIGSRCYEAFKDDRDQCLNCPATHAGQLPEAGTIEVDGMLGGRIVRVTHSPVEGFGGRLFLEILEDVTEQRQEARALQESEQRFRELVDLLPETVFEADAIGRITFGNRVAYEKFGYTPEEFENGINLLDNCAPADLERMKINMGKVMAGAAVNPREYMLQRSDGTPFPAMVCTSRIMRGGRPAGIRGFVIDVTDLRRAESALTESQARFIRLTENSEDIIYRYEVWPKFRCAYVNPAVTRITGYAPAEFYADHDLGMRIMHPEDREVAMGFLGGTRNSKALTIRVIRKDARIVFIEQRNVPVFNESGTLIALEGIARDVTERVNAGLKLLQQELTLAILQERERLERDIAELLHGPIQNKLLIAQHKLAQCRELLHGDRHAFEAHLAEANSLIDDVRENGIRAASHRLHPSIISIGLVPAVRSLVESFEYQFQVDLQIQPEVTEIDDPMLDGIPEPIRLAVYRVLEESLSNICRHAQAERASIRLALTPNNELAVTVCDDGRGFSMGSVKLGLGLRSITGRVEQAGGSCEISSKAGHGTTISAWLPLTPG